MSCSKSTVASQIIKFLKSLFVVSDTFTENYLLIVTFHSDRFLNHTHVSPGPTFGSTTVVQDNWMSVSLFGFMFKGNPLGKLVVFVSGS